MQIADELRFACEKIRQSLRFRSKRMPDHNAVSSPDQVGGDAASALRMVRIRDVLGGAWCYSQLDFWTDTGLLLAVEVEGSAGDGADVALCTGDDAQVLGGGLSSGEAWLGDDGLEAGAELGPESHDLV